MPKYDFKCTTCGSEFEFFKLRSEDKVKCPNKECKERRPEKLEKLVSTGTSFQLKGKGWYKDGY